MAGNKLTQLENGLKIGDRASGFGVNLKGMESLLSAIFFKESNFNTVFHIYLLLRESRCSLLEPESKAQVEYVQQWMGTNNKKPSFSIHTTALADKTRVDTTGTIYRISSPQWNPF